MKLITNIAPILTLIIVLVIALFFIECNQKQKNHKSAQENNLFVPGSTLLFDGETLNSWKITQFGPQGPVNVSEGRIILGNINLLSESKGLEYIIEALREILKTEFKELQDPVDLPLLLRNNSRTYKYQIAQITFWQKK